jgi:hypothetical protein
MFLCGETFLNRWTSDVLYKADQKPLEGDTDWQKEFDLD